MHRHSTCQQYPCTHPTAGGKPENKQTNHISPSFIPWAIQTLRPHFLHTEKKLFSSGGFSHCGELNMQKSLKCLIVNSRLLFFLTLAAMKQIYPVLQKRLNHSKMLLSQFISPPHPEKRNLTFQMHEESAWQ